MFSYSLKALQLLLGSVFRCFSHITDPEELRLTAELEELGVFPFVLHERTEVSEVVGK